MPTQIDEQGEERREEDLNEQVRALQDRRRHGRLGEELGTGEEEGVDRIGDRQRRDEHRQGLGQQQLLAPNRRREHRLERALLALADHRVAGDNRRHEGRDAQQDR